jgi:hypothetical protein
MMSTEFVATIDALLGGTDVGEVGGRFAPFAVDDHHETPWLGAR